MGGFMFDDYEDLGGMPFQELEVLFGSVVDTSDPERCAMAVYGMCAHLGQVVRNAIDGDSSAVGDSETLLGRVVESTSALMRMALR